MTEPVAFDVEVPDLERHLIEVRIDVPGLEDVDHVDLCMPVWSPGSYKVRDYARHVQNFRAEGPDGRNRASHKTDKSTWRVECTDAERVTVHYEVYAHTLNVREKHVDASHAFYQPTAVYLYPEGRLDSAATLQLHRPDPEWEIYCGLETIDGDETRRYAPDFDALYDAPVEMGDHDELDFVVDDVPHRMVFWGEGNWDRERLERDLPAIVSAHGELFGELPYDDYTFITLLSNGAYGGLEHRNSTSLLYPQNDFGHPPDDEDEPPIADDDYLNFLTLVAHELFHAWNVKRIYPAALESFDYQAENYVPELWTIEGITSYFDRFALFRAGLVDADRYLEFLADRIGHLENTPGRAVQSIREAGHDAWVKLYQADEQTVNSTVSYYLKGALVSFALDLRLRRATEGERSLDDILRHLWREYGPGTERGYPDGIYRELAEEYGGRDFRQFFERYVHGTAEFDWASELEPFGLVLERELDEDSPECWAGLELESGKAGPRVKRVRADGPAYDADLDPGDELAAVDGWRVEDLDDWEARLEEHDEGDALEVLLFRRGRTIETTLPVEERPPDDFALRRAPNATETQLARLGDWLGTRDIETIEDEQ